MAGSEARTPFLLDESKMKLHREISRRLRQQRVDKNVTLNEAAPRLGLSASVLQRLESGESTVAVHVIVAAVKYYGVSLGELIPLE